MMKSTVADVLKKIPGKASAEWPMGEPFTQAFAHGSMSVEVYAPKGTDIQTPHDQDELYFIHSGHGGLLLRASVINLSQAWYFSWRLTSNIVLRIFHRISLLGSCSGGLMAVNKNSALHFLNTKVTTHAQIVRL